LSEPDDFSKSEFKYDPVPEDKTTGEIFFVSVNEYYKKMSSM